MATTRKIKLGDKVRDTVSGFEGIAIGSSLFLHGCTRVGVQPMVDKDGKLPEAQWFDEPQLEKVKAKAAKTGSRNTGGPMVSVPTRNLPG